MSRRKSFFITSQETQIQLKHQEEQLSNEIDLNVRTLALLHPLSDTAQQILVKDTFLKPNKLAFQHIVHYLIMIINSMEYRKRFRWPIRTSRDETDYRVAALAYFNECHRNFKWDCGPFKMQVVLFPSGVEFMKIIVELSVMAMRTVLKENGSSNDFISINKAKAMLRATEEVCEEMGNFCRRFRTMSIDMESKTNQLQIIFNRLLRKTKIQSKEFNQSFLLEWASHQKTIINEQILPSLENLEIFFSKCQSFENNLVSSKPLQLNIDKDKMKHSGFLKVSQNLTHQFDYNGLYEWLRKSMPELKSSVYFEPPWPLLQLEREMNLLEQYRARVDDLSNRIDSLRYIDQSMHTSWTCEQDGSDDIAKENAFIYWSEKLVLTPTVKCPMKKDCRIALWELMPTIDSPSRVANTALLRTDTWSSDDALSLSDLNSNRGLSSKLDPMSMLNVAMQRKKGFPNSKGSPRRSSLGLSPARLVEPNSPGHVHSSTMIHSTDGTSDIKINNINCYSPLRKSLF